MIAKLPQHNCQSSAALLHTLCSIAAEVVQDSCLNCATMLHNLCQAAAEILALWFCDLADYLLTCLRYGLAGRRLRHLLEDDDEIPDV